MTSPPPRLMTRALTSVNPAFCQASTVHETGYRREWAEMFWPRDRPTPYPSRPPTASPPARRSSLASAHPAVAHPLDPAAPRELQRDPGGARRDIQDHALLISGPISGLISGRRQHPVDHGRTPSSVLPEGQDLGQPVVAGGQRIEQFTCEAVGTRNIVGHGGSPGSPELQRDTEPSTTVTPATGARVRAPSATRERPRRGTAVI